MKALFPFASALLLGLLALSAPADEVVSDLVEDYAVTVYRAPDREQGAMDLDLLGGFALISETRRVSLPAGLSRLRFEGVAEGILPASALVTGLPDGVIEKNRDAALLSPSALIEATVGKAVVLKRTDPKSGRVEERHGKLASGADGVVFQSADGIEALRCTGLPETFEFDPPQGLSARPTLSVLVKSDAPITREVTLSYLAVGFDWAANYTATLSPDEHELDLGAWVTLANGNGAGFPSARTQVVAGRVHRETDEVVPIALGRPIMAQCWPQGTTSDLPPLLLELDRPSAPMTRAMAMMAPVAAAKDALYEVVVTGAKKVQEEQLGDLKLYRVPDRTTVAARQSKQVRLLDRERIPVKLIYRLDLEDLGSASDEAWTPAVRLLRTKNSPDNHLGLPLPAGSVEVYGAHGELPLLEDATDLKDTALDEEVELKLSPSRQVQVQFVSERRGIDSARAEELPVVPGVSLRSVKHTALSRAVVANALPHPVDFELELSAPDGLSVVRCDHKVEKKDGKPLVRLSIPAHGEATVRFVVAGIDQRFVPEG